MSRYCSTRFSPSLCFAPFPPHLATVIHSSVHVVGFGLLNAQSGGTCGKVVHLFFGFWGVFLHVSFLIFINQSSASVVGTMFAAE